MARGHAAIFHATGRVRRILAYAALFTLPERMHFVQILNLLLSPPPTSTFTLLKFISQRRRVRRFE
jgi:hypothetical protein